MHGHTGNHSNGQTINQGNHGNRRLAPPQGYHGNQSQPGLHVRPQSAISFGDRPRNSYYGNSKQSHDDSYCSENALHDSDRLRIVEGKTDANIFNHKGVIV